MLYIPNMDTLNAIGLDSRKSSDLAASLNGLLAQYSIFYQNVRGYHWNISGDKFFELHAKFEELYTDLQTKIDEIAERILTLGHTPEHRFTEYVRMSGITESPKVADGNTAVAQILDAFKIVIAIQRNLLAQSADLGDEGTNALMSDYIRQQEKMVWMYSAYVER